jgi:hypothetical protein
VSPRTTGLPSSPRFQRTAVTLAGAGQARPSARKAGLNPHCSWIVRSRPGSFVPEPLRRAGKTLLRLSVIRTRRATIEARAPCRWPAQRFSCTVTACSALVPKRTNRVGSTFVNNAGEDLRYEWRALPNTSEQLRIRKAPAAGSESGLQSRSAARFDEQRPEDDRAGQRAVQSAVLG